MSERMIARLVNYDRRMIPILHSCRPIKERRIQKLYIFLALITRTDSDFKNKKKRNYIKLSTQPCLEGLRILPTTTSRRLGRAGMQNNNLKLEILSSRSIDCVIRNLLLSRTMKLRNKKITKWV